jgi:hypothetical protein
MGGEMGGSASRVVGKRDGQGRVADRPFGGMRQGPGAWDNSWYNPGNQPPWNKTSLTRTIVS